MLIYIFNYMNKYFVTFLTIFFLFICCTTNINNFDSTAKINNSGDPSINFSSLNGELFIRQLYSPSLENNILEDSPIQNINIYLPPSYNTTNNYYPLVIFLHGYTDSYRILSSYISTIDRRMFNNDIREFIIIAPNGYNRYEGSFYVNSPVTGNWEDYIASDLINFMEDNFRVIRNRQSRGIFGHSMGGYGAFHIGFRNPDKFSVVYCMSGGFFSENIDQLRHALDNSYSIYPNFANAYGAAFAYNSSGGFDVIPRNQIYSINTNDEIFIRWINGFGNLNEKVENYLLLTDRLNAIGIDVGSRDEYNWMIEGSEYLSNILTTNNIPHQFEIYEGTHNDRILERINNIVLPFFSDNLIFE